MILLVFHGWWVKLLEDSCYYVESIQIKNFYDVSKLILDDDIKNAFKKFRNLPEEAILKDMKRIHRLNPFNHNVLTKLEMRNPIFSQDVFLEEGRQM